MRTTPRASVIAVVLSALVLSVPVLVSAGAEAAPAAASQADGRRAYTRAEALALLAKVQAALNPAQRLPRRQLGDPLPRRDLSLMLRELQVAKASLPAKEQSIVDSLGRPVPANQGCTDYTPVLQAEWKAKASTHFCLHYRVSGTGAATPKWAQATLEVMEKVYSAQVTNLHYRRPLLDNDGKYDVFLDQIGNEGYYGFCTTDTGGSTSTAWCGLDNDFARDEFGVEPGNALRVTAAHEFFHAVQFAYDAGDSTWFLEGTAVWMEDQVYPTINDYLQYLPHSQIRQSRVPVDTTGTFERYAAVIFWKYLSEGYYSTDIIRQVWNSAASSNGSRNGIQAVISVLKSKGVSFGDAFARYSLWTTLPPGTYADRARFPKPLPWATAKLTTSARDTGQQGLKLDHLSSATVVLLPSTSLPTQTRLQISVDTPSRIVGRVRIQERRLNGSVTYKTMALNSSGNGVTRLYFSGKSTASVRVTLVNVTTSANDQTFLFRARLL